MATLAAQTDSQPPIVLSVRVAVNVDGFTVKVGDGYEVFESLACVIERTQQLALFYPSLPKGAVLSLLTTSF
jgi:hypothetical protein